MRKITTIFFRLLFATITIFIINAFEPLTHINLSLNIFNILMVLGIASAISPISIITENIIDLCVLIVFTICAWIFAGTKKKIGRAEGLCMVALYAAYAVYIIVR